MGNVVRLLAAIGLFLSVAFISHPAMGQGGVTTATLTGVISDSSGARVPHATVTLSSAAAGISREFVTDANGNYTFSFLPPANYQLNIVAKGFKEYSQNGIGLSAGQTAEQDVALSVGSQSERVVVTAQAPLLNTNNANIRADISAKQVVELPLNLRNIYGLATLNSSVNNSAQTQTLGNLNTTGAADQDISFFNFGGGFFGSTAFLLDGVWDVNSDWEA